MQCHRPLLWQDGAHGQVAPQTEAGWTQSPYLLPDDQGVGHSGRLPHSKKVSCCWNFSMLNCDHIVYRFGVNLVSNTFEMSVKR